MADPAEPTRPWVAAALAVACTGLGHLYAGRPGAALAIHAGWLAAAGACALAASTHGFAAGAAVLGAMVAASIAQAVFAARAARCAEPVPRRWFSRWPALVGFYAAVTALAAVLEPLMHRSGEGFYVASSSMAPALLRGDLVWVAKAAPADLRGAVVLVGAPAASPGREPVLKRVAAVEGEIVEVRDGELWVNGSSAAVGPCSAQVPAVADGTGAEFIPSRCRQERAPSGWTTLCFGREGCGDVPPLRVPAGHVYLLGDARDRSADSRHFGPVPAVSILGEPRFVYLSFASGAPAAGRIGLAVR